MHIPSISEKIAAAYPKMKDEFGYANVMQAPKIEKILVSVGTGRMSRNDKKKNEFIADRLARVTGQKPSARPAKQSIASFKLREGEIIGQMVTLRGARMAGFLEKFLGIAIPRTKDFRGFNKKAIDEMGNMTIGVKEHTVFPETADEDLKDVFGMAVTIVTNLKTKEETARFLELLGFPFRDVTKDEKKRVKIEKRGKKK
jgi:large subunit ribosomal protein L5